MEETEINTQTQIMEPASITTYIAIIFKNLLWLLALAFYPAMDFIIQMMPFGWRGNLDDFKLIVGAVIMVLVVFKLLIEIVKLIKKK